MAEAFAIIGLVSNILSFIDFGIKLASETRNVRDSLHGTTAEVRELEIIVEDVERYHEKVQKLQSLGQELSAHEKSIMGMVKYCRNIAEDLHKIIERLHVRQGRSKTLESSRVLFQGFRKQRDIDALRARLDALDKRIRVNVEHIIRSDHHSSLSAKLDALKTAQDALAISYDAKLDQIRDEILTLVAQTRTSEGATQVAQLTGLKTKFDALGEEHTACTKQTATIRSLYFSVLRRRWSQIPKADKASNTWIFDTALTPFTVWLESTDEHDGLFCITGRAGSGKSTLMKFVTENPRTFEYLEGWAGTTKLCTASYYFWNQGYEMQKSQVGLLQSLLYQIFKSVPRLIEIVCPNRLEHEEWDVEELKATFARIATQKDLEVKFCFFIDGLDEYNGAEEDVVSALEFLSISKDIKICASTRPRSVFERFFNNTSRTFDIKSFTKEDMGRHVQRLLGENENFQRLANADTTCVSIMKVIANLAHGVWLWVFLITRDLVHAVDRYEGVDTLWNIVNLFPADLEAYFERMVKAVKPQYLEEMSQIFLITVDELQPLPLYAFSLLEYQRKNPAYATSLPIRPIREEDLKSEYPKWKSLIRNRCSDLLVVNDEEHPCFPGPTVDFLHRTVAEFLQDNYYHQLRANLKTEFSSKSTLCKICLVMLKSLPDINYDIPESINEVMGLTDELLYYAYETERTDPSPTSSLVEVLDEVDRVNTHHARGTRNHWMHDRDAVVDRGYHVYREGDNYNFLAPAVQAHLVKCSFDSAQAPDEREKFMLQQYGKAIQSLQPLLRCGDKASVTVILVTCQLFTLLEYLRGQYQLAESHLRNGLKVLMNMTTKKDRSHDGVLVIKPASYEKSIDQGIVRSFATLHMQNNLFGSGLEDLDIFLQPIENNIPYPTFTTIEEAKDALDVLLHGIVLIAQQYRKMGPGTEDEIAAVTAGQEDIMTSLAMWYDAYLSTLPSVDRLALAAGRKPDELWAFGGKTPPAKLPTGREPSVLKLLLMYHAMAGIMCGCLQVQSEQHYEAYTQTFLTILVHAIHIFEEYTLAKSIPDNVNLHDSIGECGSNDKSRPH
ncbi:hypothetical protein J4E85_010295 [Alternaria conjuncta]|uniref:uncharacterized protein n=1 Tax=Alternaria conjuncta TaxID=181017 RepID=UPI00222121F2|nr:uncharacterized protein J4E85_010295 [Alternaria conjuncta]KAI4916207.1 hypothetical protein J4E85_010295 [Alternaria conjuncta]